jgi:2',3'-cyclic-nucleotide 2'-phosphodiesterase (5'-nucleotidase family)
LEIFILVIILNYLKGSLYKLLAPGYLLPEEVPELEFFNYCEYDSIILGNHGYYNIFNFIEFDGREEVLVNMIKKTEKLKNFKLNIISSNFYLDKKKECEKYKSFSKKYFKKYLIKELRNNKNETLRVGILGFFGLEPSFSTIQ